MAAGVPEFLVGHFATAGACAFLLFMLGAVMALVAADMKSERVVAFLTAPRPGRGLGAEGDEAGSAPVVSKRRKKAGSYLRRLARSSGLRGLLCFWLGDDDAAEAEGDSAFDLDDAAWRRVRPCHFIGDEGPEASEAHESSDVFAMGDEAWIAAANNV